MAVTLRLPAQVLSFILQYFSLEDIQKLRSVSADWNEHIEIYCGTMVLINNKNWDWTSKAQRTVIATFDSFNGPFTAAIPFTQTLQEVTFYRTLRKNNFISILQKCTQIRKLVFCKIFLDQDEPIQTPYQIQLPKLVQLHIQTQFGIGTQISNDYVNICRLMSEVLCSLEEFCFWCPNHQLDRLEIGNSPNCGSNTDISTWIVRILHENRSSLQIATFNSWVMPANLYFDPEINGQFVGKPFQLDALHVTCDLPETWEPMIRNQHFLSVLHIDRDAYTLLSPACQAIVQSCDSISQVFLKDQASKVPKVMDLAIFKDCFELECLGLFFNSCLFQNMGCLPFWLRILKLKGHHSIAQVSTLSLILPNLEVLSLQNTSLIPQNLSNVGAIAVVDVDLFRRLILSPFMRELQLSNFPMNWSKVLGWCSGESSKECVMKVFLDRYKGIGNPYNIRALISAHLSDDVASDRMWLLKNQR